MTLDILHFIDSKGGNAAEIRESQRKRGLSVELVDEVIQMYADWVKMDFEVNKLSKEVNAVQKEIGAKKKAKENADSLVAKKKSLDEQVLKKRSETKEFEQSMRQKASTVGNIVGKNVPVSMNEDDNTILRTWHPKGPNATVEKRTNIMPHHEVLLRLDAIDLERGAKIAGHRGYFLTNDGIDLNQALITYGLHFLRERGYTTLQPPFFMNRDMMAKTAQLEQFDEELYKVVVSSSSSTTTSSTNPTTSDPSNSTTQPTDTETDKYLIATSEQPISCFHSSEWFESPSTQLPLKYAGYSTCFRKEAGSAGRDTWGIFRVHQFEKVEQFVITSPFPDLGAPSASPNTSSPPPSSTSSNPNDPSSTPSNTPNTPSPTPATPDPLPPSWQMLETMLLTSEHFYQSLSLPYRVVGIVSGALNLAAAEKRDLEAWFPFQGEWKELVSCSNCTDYQSRRLEIRAGLKSKEQTRKQYVHMLNGTLCATERALCCLVENWQTEEGLVIPEVLRPYMQNREFLPWKKELPKNLQRKQA